MDDIQLAQQFYNYLNFLTVEPHIHAIAPYFVDFILHRHLPEFILDQWFDKFVNIFSFSNFQWQDQVWAYQETFGIFSLTGESTNINQAPSVTNNDFLPIDTIINYENIFSPESYASNDVHVVTDDEEEN
tara:strand:+ start:2527 stop:2916 length:390 start_codon:yes stop_codon:yes gene_type:complete